jgi:predicted nucleotidyltransferase
LKICAKYLLDGFGAKMTEANLSPDRLRTLLEKFKEQHGKQYQLRALGYFGSYARNTSTSESDVDIVFDTDAPNLFMTVMLKQDLEESIGRQVDVLQLRGLTNPRLKARIEREAVYV